MVIKTLKILVALLFPICFSLMVIVRQYFAFERPETPEVELGRTIPVTVNYNKTVYVTMHERNMLYSTYWGTFGCLIAIGSYMVFQIPKRNTDHAV
jgi:hypothetical protein